MILDRLKTETAEAHDRVEALAASNRIMDGSFSPEEYKQLVARNYILHAAYEHVLEKAVTQLGIHELQYSERQKLPLLRSDLHDMGVPLPEVSLVPSLQLDTPEQVLGCMYVLEGSTLGGSVIRRRLISLPDFANLPFRFYGAYGERTGPMWTSFRNVVVERIQTPEQEQATVEAATAMFNDVAYCFAAPVVTAAA